MKGAIQRQRRDEISRGGECVKSVSAINGACRSGDGGVDVIIVGVGVAGAALAYSLGKESDESEPEVGATSFVVAHDQQGGLVVNNNDAAADDQQSQLILLTVCLILEN